MLFEVINPNNLIVMHTESTSCIPNRDVLQSMHDAGYMFRLDKRKVTVSAIVALENLDSKSGKVRSLF